MGRKYIPNLKAWKISYLLIFYRYVVPKGTAKPLFPYLEVLLEENLIM
jgi:hypothetical protein